jgi:hypothetical protein
LKRQVFSCGRKEAFCANGVVKKGKKNKKMKSLDEVDPCKYYPKTLLTKFSSLKLSSNSGREVRSLKFEYD